MSIVCRARQCDILLAGAFEMSWLIDWLIDNVYNWLVNYLAQRNHCTKFNGETSSKTDINASVVQGSGIGPSCYVIGASDLRAKNILNIILKYADDSYLIIPSNNADTIQDELDHLAKMSRHQ